MHHGPDTDSAKIFSRPNRIRGEKYEKKKKIHNLVNLVFSTCPNMAECTLICLITKKDDRKDEETFKDDWREKICVYSFCVRFTTDVFYELDESGLSQLDKNI